MLRTLLSAAALALACSAAHGQSLINPCGGQATVCQAQSLSVSSTSNVYVISVPPNYASVTVQLTGLTGTGAVIKPELAADWNGVVGTFAPVAFTAVSGATVTNPLTATTDGRYCIPAAQAVELAVTTAGTGAVTASYALSAASCAGAAASISGAVTSNQGSAGSSAWLTSDAQNASYSVFTAMTVGGAALSTPTRGLEIVCTVSGNVVIQAANGSTLSIPVIGYTGGADVGIRPYAITQITNATTATCVYTGLN